MCGITGMITPCGATREHVSLQLTKMMHCLRHRGPDDEGRWIDDEQGVALGHRRLSILEISQAAHQPMVTACGRFVIVFNGEIYNHLDLRQRLEASNDQPAAGWRGHSDTDTLLASILAWGVKKTLEAAIGMFAFALWDRSDNSLTLARDRIGEKPLYYGWQNSVFLFGSELKSLRAHGAFRSEINWQAASTFLRLNYIPAPASIYQGILKLLPGTVLHLTQQHIQQQTLPQPQSYWSLNDAAEAGMTNPYRGNFHDAVDELEMLVRQATQLQSVADVPVGAFLSGGIDSSVVVAMMQSSTTSQVTTFSIGMPDAAMDESCHAAAVAKHLGTRHVAHTIQAREALELIPRLSEIWDEPFADSSQIPTYLVSALAKERVSVALSGDGGDEFFLGYPYYRLYQKLWVTRHFGHLPWRVQSHQHVSSNRRRANSLITAWRQPDAQALHRYWVDRYRQGLVPIPEQQGITHVDIHLLPDPATSAALWDAGIYLPDDILAKVDRASMANSLETRAPLLDHRIIEFALRLPLRYKLHRGVGKRVLREVLYRHVPKELVDRPKMGFSIPLAGWLTGELRPWAESLLDLARHNAGAFDQQMIEQLWREHLSGERVHTEQLWGLLSLLAFMDSQ
jgi:asparagine synthase (glutamine-hydrolysing)